MPFDAAQPEGFRQGLAEYMRQQQGSGQLPIFLQQQNNPSMGGALNNMVRALMAGNMSYQQQHPGAVQGAGPGQGLGQVPVSQIGQTQTAYSPENAAATPPPYGSLQGGLPDPNMTALFAPPPR